MAAPTIESRAYGIAFAYRKKVDEDGLRGHIAEVFADVVETDPRVVALVAALKTLSKDWRLWTKDAQTAGERERLRKCADEVNAALKSFEK